VEGVRGVGAGWRLAHREFIAMGHASGLLNSLREVDSWEGRFTKCVGVSSPDLATITTTRHDNWPYAPALSLSLLLCYVRFREIRIARLRGIPSVGRRHVSRRDRTDDARL